MTSDMWYELSETVFLWHSLLKVNLDTHFRLSILSPKILKILSPCLLVFRVGVMSQILITLWRSRFFLIHSLLWILYTHTHTCIWIHILEEGMATHSSILAWRIPWTEEPGGLQFIGLQRIRHDWVTNTHACARAHTQTHTHTQLGLLHCRQILYLLSHHGISSFLFIYYINSSYQVELLETGTFSFIGQSSWKQWFLMVQINIYEALC